MKTTLRSGEAIRLLFATLALAAWGVAGLAADTSFEQYADTVSGGDAEIRLGIDTWFLWTAGDQAFWGRAFPTVTRGEVDLLRLLDARVLPRSQRFAVIGTINDPSCVAGSAPDPYGFVMDTCPTPPTDPGRLKLFGLPTGIIGLRKFPNPNFDPGRWAKAGGALGYLSRNEETFDPSLEPPYLIGVACAVCHVSFDPLHPPANPSEPSWANLAPGLGNQYFEEGRVFTLGIHDRKQFRWQAGQSQPMGTSDTSRIPNDFLNNPTAINPIFNFPARFKIRVAERIGPSQAAFIRGMVPPIPEDLRGDRRHPRMLTMHGLMDGADSVGLALGSMRVYCNIGGFDASRFLASLPTAGNEYHQQPFDIQAAKAKNLGGLWTTTESFLPALQKYLMTFGPMPLGEAPGGSAFLQDPPGQVRLGKIVFAENCARCHSSKQPSRWEWGRGAYRRLVLADDFLDDNFLSNDRRYPLPLIRTQAARALATNAGRDQIWQDFSSLTYKELPPAGTLTLFNPLSPRRPIRFRLPAGGRGYYRTPTLVSMWATAPYLHNNSIGAPTKDPSVAGRMRAFEAGVRQLLWPETRRGLAAIARTTTETYLTDSLGQPILVPSRPRGSTVPFMIPAGTPIDLYSNLHPDDLPRVIAAQAHGGPRAAAAEALKRSRCPDLIPDHGHLFGTRLSDREKEALITFLKRL